MSDSGVTVLGPREERALLVNGWTVPFVEAIEQDGGQLLVVVDQRFGFTVGAKDFDEVARLVATVYAVAIGMRHRPGADDDDATRAHNFAHAVVPPTCFPRQMVELTAAAKRASAEGERHG